MHKKGLLQCLQALNFPAYLQTRGDQMWSGMHLAPDLPTEHWEERCPNMFLFHSESKKWPWMIQNQLVPAEGLACALSVHPNPTKLLQSSQL